MTVEQKKELKKFLHVIDLQLAQLLVCIDNFDVPGPNRQNMQTRYNAMHYAMKDFRTEVEKTEPENGSL